MTQRCAHCQDSPKLSKRARVFPNSRALAMHTADAHPGKTPHRLAPIKREEDPSIADMVLDARLRAAMGTPDEYDDIILEGFD